MITTHFNFSTFHCTLKSCVDCSGVNECVIGGVHGLLRWIGIPFKVYSYLLPSVTGMGLISTSARDRSVNLGSLGRNLCSVPLPILHEPALKTLPNPPHAKKCALHTLLKEDLP